MSVPTVAKSILTDRNQVYQAQDVIEIFIPPEDVPLLNPLETYLKFVVRMSSTDASNPFPIYAQPDAAAGAHSLISQIQVMDGQNMQMLEQLDTWNNWTSKYFHFNKSPGLKNLRTLMEGVSSPEGQALTSQYWEGNSVVGGRYKNVEVCLPFHMSGILGSNKVFPVVLTAGLRLRIFLGPVAQCIKAYNANGFAKAVTPDAASMGWQPSHKFSFEQPQSSLPFALGVALAAGAETEIKFKLAATAAVAGPPAIPALNACPIDGSNFPFCVGQELQYFNDANAVETAGTISAIAVAGGLVTATIQGGFTGTVAAIGRPVWALDPTNVPIKYEVSKVECVCSVVQAPPATIDAMRQKVASGSVSLDYDTFNLYRNNINARVPQPQILLPTTEHRALSLYQFPQASTTQLWLKSFEPVKDGMLNYQYNIANRLTPNRKVLVDRTAQVGNIYNWDAIHLTELEKSLGRGKISPRFLCLNSEQFGVGRELAKEGHSFNANDQEIRLQMVYSSAAGDNTEEKLLHSYLYHTRTLVISPGSVAVVY